MNDLFRMAAESMLQIYGTGACLLKGDTRKENVQISPLFSSKIYKEDHGGTLEAEANVILKGDHVPVPRVDRLLKNETEWVILSVNELCPGIYELEIKR